MGYLNSMVLVLDFNFLNSDAILSPVAHSIFVNIPCFPRTFESYFIEGGQVIDSKIRERRQEIFSTSFKNSIKKKDGATPGPKNLA